MFCLRSCSHGLIPQCPDVVANLRVLMPVMTSWLESQREQDHVMVADDISLWKGPSLFKCHVDARFEASGGENEVDLIIHLAIR